MSEDPPPLPPGFPPPPPPPPPPGFEEGEDEAEDEPSSEPESPPIPAPPGLEVTDTDSPSVPPPPPGIMEIEDRAIIEDDDSEDEEVIGQFSVPEPLDYLADSLQQNLPDAGDSESDEESLEDSLAALGGSDSETSVHVVDWDDTPASSFSSAEDGSSTDSMSTPIVTPTSHPYLRSAAEIDAIPGDKLHATLSEIEESTLNPDGTIHRQSIEGELILRNSSKKHRAWDIEVLLSTTDSTDIGGRSISVR